MLKELYKEDHYMPVATRTVVTGVGNVVNEHWWLTFMQSILAIFFGIAAIFWPGLTLVTLVYIFSAFILIWGIIEIVHALMSIERQDSWWLTIIFGLIGLVVGVYLVRHPHVSFTTLILLIGITFIVRGVFDILGTFLDNRSDTHRVLLMIVGLAGVVAGIVTFFEPAKAGVAFVWILGLYALIFGVINFALSIESRRDLLA